MTSEYGFKQVDFENPSALFVLEDILKGLIGGPLLYNPYFRTFALGGNESVLDFGCGGGVGSKCLAKLLNEGGHLTCVDISSFHVIHDIGPEDRQDIVTVLCQKLKTGGTIFVREPIRKSHGMLTVEIRTLFANAGLREAGYKESKSEYEGRFTSAAASI